MSRFLFSMVLVLSACGGGGGSGDSAAPIQSAALNPAIVAFGDSTQAGFTPPSTYTPPSAEASRILGVVIKNEAVSGTTSLQLLDGTDGSSTPWADRIKGARIVLINHGINDNSRPVADYKATLTALVTAAKSFGKTVVLQTPNPIVPGGAISGAFNIQEHEAKVAAMREVAAETGAVLCDDFAAIRSSGYESLANTPDGVHPSPTLYTYKGQLMADCLRSLL